MVSAYNSVGWQTEGNPQIAAWGDTLRPGMRVIAVSRDLPALGLDYGTEVEIEGLEGVYRVADKMNRRFRRHIDIYMGEAVDSAREWGRRKRCIRWKIPAPDRGNRDL